MSALIAHIYIRINEKEKNLKINVDNTQSIKLSNNKFPSPSTSDVDIINTMSTMTPKIKLNTNNEYFIDIRKYPDHIGCHAQRLTKQQKKYRQKHWKFHHHTKKEFTITKLATSPTEIQLRLYDHHSSPTVSKNHHHSLDFCNSSKIL